MAMMNTMLQSLSFGGVNSADYGIYISGEGTFDAPKRSVELVSVPGRNGAISIDNGYWENVEVKYPAFTYSESLGELVSNVRAFRNAIVSQKGYQRLVDTIHPEEYREALFVDGLEVSPLKYNTLVNFTLTFNCKPQRFLMSGEAEVSVTSGEKLFNPTPFDAKPMAMVHGYGTLNIGDFVIELDGGLIGKVVVLAGEQSATGYESTTSLSTSVDYSALSDSINAGDDITINAASANAEVKCKPGNSFARIDDRPTSSTRVNFSAAYREPYEHYAFTAFPAAAQTYTKTTTTSFELANGTTFNTTTTLTITNNPSGSINVAGTITTSADVSAYVNSFIWGISIEGVSIDSTVTSIGDPTYIDCDIGEAYLIDGSGNIVSLNSLIELGSDLPVLAPGDTTITYDNTITAVEVVPRWWLL